MSRKRWIGGSILLLIFILTLLKGKSLYVTIQSQLKKRETTASVQQRLAEKVATNLQPHLNKIGLQQLPDRLIIVGLKQEQLLEVYAAVKGEMKRLKVYPFTAMSGKLGPKLQEGDKQIPEGIYQIEYLNPNSAYYLSLKVNYPNSFDQKKAQLDNRSQLGGDIFIHGKAVTIGCIPIGDEAIEEVFTLGAHAYAQGIKVILSPQDFRKVPEFPEIDGISWEKELYQVIARELDQLPTEDYLL
ncbi:MAG: L,D-transpeptidase family protein [Bacteroidota bacterium]